MEDVVHAILQGMSRVNRHQIKFLIVLFNTLCVFHGKATFRNLSRYSILCEKTYSRWFRRSFDFAMLNSELLCHEIPPESEIIAAIDASFITKSGKRTEGLGWFYRGSTGQVEKGLEMSLICCIDVRSNTAYGVDSVQTIDEPKVKGTDETRIDQYAKQVVKAKKHLRKQGIRYLVADSYYSKRKFVTAVRKECFHLVGKLRHDANLKWLYEGEYSGLGAPRKYDGKVDVVTEMGRFDFEAQLEDGVKVWSKIVWSVNFKSRIKLVVLQWNNNSKPGTALLYSTDLNLDALTIVKYYKARFQIEFVFRDAKQHTGLLDCQSTKKEAIHTHINASITALNLMKLEDRRTKMTQDATVISITSIRRRKMNLNLISHVFEKLGVSQTCEKARSVLAELGNYGVIAA